MISRVGSSAGRIFSTSDSALSGIRSAGSGSSESDLRDMSRQDARLSASQEKDLVEYQIAETEEDNDDWDIESNLFR